MSIREIVGNCAAAVAVAAALGSPAAAQYCLDYGQHLRWVRCGEPAPCVGITMVGTLLYVSTPGTGLVIWDAGDPAEPVPLGVAATPGACLGNIVVGDLAFVADGFSPGFCVVDVSDPHAPVTLGADGPGAASWCYDLAMVVPDTVWVADGYYGIRIIDVSDPAAPGYLGAFAPGGAAWAVEVFGGHAYLADDAGLKVYDVTRGAANVDQVGYAPAPGLNYGLTRMDDIVFVLGYEGTTVIDVTDPTAPVTVGSYDTPGQGYRMQITGHHAIVAEGGESPGYQAGLEILDVTDPAAPTPVSFLATTRHCYDVQVAGKFAFVTTEQRGLFVADIANPAPAPLAGAVALPIANQVAATDGLAYVVGSHLGLQVVDITDPAAAAVIGTYVGTYPVDVVLQGDYAYLASGSPGLEIIDVADPATPVRVGSVDPFGASVAVAVAGDWAFLAAGTWGVQVIDIAEPAAPVQRTTLALPDDPYGLTVAGTFLYIACDRSGLQVADIADPLAPVLVGALPLPGIVDDVTVAAGLAYVSGRGDGLHIVDVNDPAAPVLVATLRTPGEVRDAAVAADLLYIADYDGGLQIADISDPAAPRLVGTRETPDHSAIGVVLAGDLVCVADWTGGLQLAWRHCGGASAQPDLPAPAAAALRAYPNPFNARTTITFELPLGTAATLHLYDVAGRLVRTLLAGDHDRGGLQATPWDGRDDAGRTVAAGVYVCRLEGGGRTATTRLALVR
ncbi:MAG: T9SS type A sorting domain-containing protein [Krumholzibacteria bacterium]|nr:T9SS type A sorting domain-containing protein [Candidatus Krumholzibacteria bacterium]